MNRCRSRINVVVVLAAVLSICGSSYAQCGDPEAGTCCEMNPNFTPFCNDSECCEIVCAISPGCCNQFWSTTCAILATNYCHALCGDCGSGSPSNNNCCIANGTPYCYDADCCETVCDVDPSCCENEWDQSCADLAWKHCPDLPGCAPPTCGDAGTGDCCEANGSPNCEDAPCCNAVCDEDPYCCEVEWDECCAHLATQHCSWVDGCFLPEWHCEGHCGGQAPAGCWCDSTCNTWGDCCYDACYTCCQSENPCSVGNCSNPPLPSDAFSCEGNCGCAAIGGCWCDESCCEIGDCCEDKTPRCFGCAFGHSPSYFGSCVGECGGQSFSGCWCDDGCTDLFDCCWGICNHCPSLSQCDLNPANLLGEEHVNIFDLLELLTRWGECEYERCFVMEPCEGDFNHDGRINVEDLMFLLQNWGE